ncbi:MAG TPA: bifunctional DNA primase/polymerase [Actinocrinis sp.]|nr:bifunctional DNA primase/polymerase [Actinocrinis sp.]
MPELIPEPEPPDRDPAAAAVALAARGFAVFPLRPNAKTPAVPKDWEHAASTDPQRLAALFHDRRANLAVACGPSRLLVVDLDVADHAHGAGTGPAAAKDDDSPARPGQSTPRPAHGADVLRSLAAGREIPRTLTVATPTGGRHLYFRMPSGVTLRNTAGRLGPLIDTRAGGGYVVAPGSTINGLPYRIVDDAPVAELPGWIVDRLATPTIDPDAGQSAPAGPGALPRPGSPVFPGAPGPGAGPEPGPDASGRPDRLRVAYTAAALRNEVERVHTAAPGTRNDTLNRAAYSLGRLIGAGLLDRDEVSAQLQHAALGAGLPPRETAATTRSGLAAGIAHPRIPLAIAARSQHSTIHGKVFEHTFFGETVGAAAGSGPGSASVSGAGTGTGAGAGTELVGEVGATFPGHDPALEPAGWAGLFGELVELRHACRNLLRELVDFRPVPAAVANPGAATAAPGPRSLSQNTTNITAVLHAASEAQDDVGFAAAALTHCAEWHLIRATTDALRDLLDEVEHGVRDCSAALQGNAALNSLVQTLVVSACRQNARLAAEITGQLSKQNLGRTPVWAALHTLRRVADNAAAFLGDQHPARS